MVERGSLQVLEEAMLRQPPSFEEDSVPSWCHLGERKVFVVFYPFTFWRAPSPWAPSVPVT